MNARRVVKKALNKAGIRINGDNPCDIKVHNERFYKDVVRRGSLGLGESYMWGWWDCEKTDELVFRLWKSGVNNSSGLRKLIMANHLVRALIANKGSRKKSGEIGKRHYDIGNDLYSLMLGKHMVYSCGFWKDAQDLDEAQLHKMDLICRKLQLKSDMRVLDIGCGFGELAKYMAENYNVKVLGVTVSEEQKNLGQSLCRGLPVKIENMDYREVVGKFKPFDRIVSVGMFEHVGWKNYRIYMETVHSLLKEQGVFLLHTIGCSKRQIFNDPWIDRYIFPGSILPSEKAIISSVKDLFTMQDWHNFGLDYDRTLMSWFKNFDENWDKIAEKYGDEFYRMWKFYLLSCAGGFRAELIYLWQIVFTKKGDSREYNSVR